MLHGSSGQMVPGGHEGQAGGEEVFRLLEVGLEGGDCKADERGGGSGEGVQADRVDALAQIFFSHWVIL